MAGYMDVPLDVAALHDLCRTWVVGPRHHFHRLPGDALITSAAEAESALGKFRRDAMAMARLRRLLADDPSCGMTCNRINDHALIERIGRMVETGAFCLAEIQPATPAPISTLHHCLQQIHPANEYALAAACKVPATTGRASVASTPGAHVGKSVAPPTARTAAPASTAKSATADEKPFLQWSMEDRFFEALRRTAPKLPAQFRNAFAEILTPEVAATVVGTLALIAGAQAIGGVFAAAFDVLLIGVAFAFLGWTAFEAGQQLGKFFYLTVTATDVTSLDYAAEALAKVVVLIGVEALLVLLTKAATKTATSWRGIATDSTKPVALYSQPTIRKVSSAEIKPVQNNATNSDFTPKAKASAAVLPDVGTKPNTAFFWSGRTKGIGGSDDAAKIAAKRGGTTLETLISERSIAMPDWNPTNPESITEWKNLSRQYANSVSGEVRAVIGQDLRPGNVWQNEELPALLKNPRVTRIITIDPFSGIERIIYP